MSLKGAKGEQLYTLSRSRATMQAQLTTQQSDQRRMVWLCGNVREADRESIFWEASGQEEPLLGQAGPSRAPVPLCPCPCCPFRGGRGLSLFSPFPGPGSRGPGLPEALLPSDAGIP